MADQVDRAADAEEFAPDELPVHGEDQPDEETVVPVTGDASEGDPAVAAGPLDLEALQARAGEAAALADKLKRVEAEFVNETKRIRRQAEESRRYAIESVVVDMLPVVDALHGARDTLGDDEASKALRQGLELVERQLDGIFQRHGIAVIEALGMPFDPTRHQAMLMVERADCEPQTVCDVLRHGYELNGRVVRAAEVVVAKAAAAATSAEDDAADAAGPEA